MDLPLRQSLLLGAYLAHRGDWVSRDEVIGLFWPEEEEQAARHNLSQLVYHCRRQSWFDGLEAERSRLRWRVASDLQLFRASIGAGAWAEAIEHYRGPLLEGAWTGLPLGFEAWLDRERETLHNAWREAMLQVAGQLERDGDYADATARLREVLARDALAEDALQAYLRCAAAAGQRESALRAFESFRAQLQHELSLEPLDDTVALAERLRLTGRVEDASVGVEAGRLTPGALPRPLTPFVGREAELDRLDRLLRDGERLVTLVGPGGSGKTRLAIEAAGRAAQGFEDGAVFVSLSNVDAVWELAPTVLEALGIQPDAARSPEDLVVETLARRSALLVLDNLEHVLDGAGIVLDWLEASPGSKALVTSRERLDFHGEVRFEVEWLACPDTGDLALEAFDAVALLIRSARRAHPGFTVEEVDREGVVRLCRLLEGMPLAIELASAWMRLMRPDEVADAIAKNLDTLASTARNVPKRHGSMRAALDYSWHLLGDDERAALEALAVFRAGFTKDGAEAVAGVNLRTLLALVNKSLLRRESTGRFERLGVVRQYCLERLEADAARLAGLRDRHAAHFLALAEDQGGPEARATWLESLARDHPELREALDHLIATGQEGLALRLAQALFDFWWLRGHYREARSYLDRALALSEERNELRAKSIGSAGAFARLCEDFEAAASLYERGLVMSRELGDRAAVAAALGNLANLRRIQGDYDSAAHLIEECLGHYRALANQRQVANALNNMGALAEYRGDVAGAEECYREALEVASAAEEGLIQGLALGNLGALAFDRGDVEEAKRLREASRAVFERLGYQVGLAITSQALGDIAAREGELAEAHGRYVQALTRFRDLGDTRGVADVLASLVDLAMREGDHEHALRLAGASRGLHERLGSVMPLPARESLERQVSVARRSLGEARVDALLREAQSLRVEAAVALVLG